MKKIWCMVFTAAVMLSACGTAGGEGSAGTPDEDVRLVNGGIETDFPEVDTGIEIPEPGGNPEETDVPEEDVSDGVSEPKAADDAPDFGIAEQAAAVQDYSESDEVRMTIDKKFREAVVIKMENLVGEPVDRGSSFTVEAKIDGEWRRVESYKGITFPMCNVWMDPESTCYDIIPLYDFFGNLPDGEYRVCKRFNKESDFDNPILLAAEFSLGSEDTPGKPGTPDGAYRYIYGRENEDSEIAEAIELTVKEIGDGGATLILRNNGEADAEYGENFRLLTRIGDRWHYIRETVENRPVSAVLYTTPAGGESEIDWVSWRGCYGDLPAGEYAVEIPVNVGGEELVAFCGGILEG